MASLAPTFSTRRAPDPDDPMDTRRSSILGVASRSADVTQRVKWPRSSTGRRQEGRHDGCSTKRPSGRWSTEDGLYAPEMNTLEKRSSRRVRRASGTGPGRATGRHERRIHMARVGERRRRAGRRSPSRPPTRSSRRPVVDPPQRRRADLRRHRPAHAYNIDPSRTWSARSRRGPKAILMPDIHVHGVPADMDAINAVAAQTPPHRDRGSPGRPRLDAYRDARAARSVRWRPSR